MTMTPEQFERWEDFALRMAKTCYATSRRPSGEWVAATVADFFDVFPADDIECIEDWDHSAEYPPCDLVSLFLDDFFSGYRRCRHCRTDDDAGKCTCYEAEQRAWRQWSDQWGGPVRCCIRAGLDVAVARSCGVLGFTAGDIRRMYPEGVPEWIARQWDEADTIGVKAVVPGVGFVPEVVGVSPRFEDMPDDAGLWL
jgi:hypothetical protein